MLLRRVTKHVKDQNWFAVGIDFFIVVVGVFIGIQVANWNDVRQDHVLSGHIMERLDAEFVAISNEVDVALQSHQRNMDGLVAIIEVIDRKELTDEKVEAFKSGLLYSYTHRSSTYRSATNQEIIANGRIEFFAEDQATRREGPTPGVFLPFNA